MKLTFTYAPMSTGKSTELLQKAFNYREHGFEVLIFTSALDNRYGTAKVASRIGISADATVIHPGDCSVLNELIESLENSEVKAIFIDECQFLSTEQVDLLAVVVDKFNIPVYCYGLRTDFSTKLFEGSRRLLEIADDIEELKNICSCGRKAIFNKRIGESTETVLIGGNDMYIRMCRECYRKSCEKKTD